jgi:O6-methylguanine-DNA--protein-cysteine methyltransferase
VANDWSTSRLVPRHRAREVDETLTGYPKLAASQTM